MNRSPTVYGWNTRISAPGLLGAGVPIGHFVQLADKHQMASRPSTRPGHWVTAQAARRERLIWIGFACFTVICALMLVLALGQRLGIASSLIFLLLVLAVRPYAQRCLDVQIRWERGARAERLVGETLDTLQGEGWTVLHDIACYDNGNVDHIVAGARGVFLIETKARSYRTEHLGRVKRQAARLHDDLGAWVTPVICLYHREGRPFRSQGVWVVPNDHLLQWLRQQNQRPADSALLARYIETL